MLLLPRCGVTNQNQGELQIRDRLTAKSRVALQLAPARDSSVPAAAARQGLLRTPAARTPEPSPPESVPGMPTVLRMTTTSVEIPQVARVYQPQRQAQLRRQRACGAPARTFPSTLLRYLIVVSQHQSAHVPAQPRRPPTPSADTHGRKLPGAVNPQARHCWR